MLIEEQIKTLLKIKAKIDLYQKVLANVKAEQVDGSTEHSKLESEHPGLLKEFCDEMIQFCSRRIDQLGNGNKAVRPEPTSDQNGTLESLVDTLDNKPAPNPPRNNPTKPAPTLGDEPMDPLSFLLKHKHLDGKKVTFKTKDGVITGTVRGLVVPNVKVETETGFVVDVPPAELKVV